MGSRPYGVDKNHLSLVLLRPQQMAVRMTKSHFKAGQPCESGVCMVRSNKRRARSLWPTGKLATVRIHLLVTMMMKKWTRMKQVSKKIIRQQTKMMRTINDVNNNVMERSEDELMHGRSEEDEENLVYR